MEKSEMDCYDLVVEVDKLFEVILKDGIVKTGVNVFNSDNNLLIAGDVIIHDTDTLQRTKSAGVYKIPINTESKGGIWDKNGQSILHKFQERIKTTTTGDVEKKILKLTELKKEAQQKSDVAKSAVKKMIQDIRQNGGRFEFNEVEDTVVQLIDIITENENPYAFLARNIHSYDDYLLNHSINVCTIGTAVLYEVNKLFKDQKKIGNKTVAITEMMKRNNYDGRNEFYSIDEIKRISIGYFLHDIGKIAVPEKLLNKNGKFTTQEFDTVRKHSHEYGRIILDRNGIKDTLIQNSVIYHHSTIYEGEGGTYPDIKDHNNIPEYVKICKLSDIYDAMTSKRSYKNAINPTEVVTSIFKMYSNKCDHLQLILHSFLKSIGNVPSGSIIKLKNKQRAFVMDRQGPVIILITDDRGEKLKNIPDPINLSDSDLRKKYEIDTNINLCSPKDSYNILPTFLKKMYAT
jgi:HD-GYP domain-containing protein (c-di-GMP phosphodiesterase class II)